MNCHINQLQARMDASKTRLTSFPYMTFDSDKNYISSFDSIKELLAPALKPLTRCTNASYYFGKVVCNLSKVTSDEPVSFPTTRPLTRVTPEAIRIAAIRLNQTTILV